MATDKSKDTEQAPPKETVIIIRPSFKKICGKDACRAALFNHLLYCVACKVVGGSDYWYGTLDDIHKGIDESWSMGKMRKELEALVEQGLIGQRHNEAKKWDRTMQYFFSENEAKILKEICKKEDVDLSSIGLPSQVAHLLNLTNAFAKYNKSIKQIKQMDLSNMSDPFVNNGGAIPKVTTKVLSKVTTKVTDTSANAPTTNKPSSNKKPKVVEYLKPDINGPTTKETITALADFYRGQAVSKRKQEEAESAIAALLNKPRPGGKGYTLKEIDDVYRLLNKITDPGEEWLIDVEWKFPCDIWVINNNIASKLTLIQKLRDEHKPKTPQQTKTFSSRMTRDQLLSYARWEDIPRYNGYPDSVNVNAWKDLQREIKAQQKESAGVR